MTQPLVCILAMPSRYDGDWRRAISEAAAFAGWDYRNYWGIDDQPIDPERPTVVVTLEETTLRDAVPTAWVVLTASPQEALAGSKFLYQIDDTAAFGHSASRLTVASLLIQGGATQYRVADKAIDVPGLGLIARGDAPHLLPPVLEDAVSALQIFSQLPPPVGASAFWPASVFLRFDDETPGSAAQTLDLTGRRRILIHGPYLAIPAGRWRATIEFEFETPVGSAPFQFEWGEVADIEVYDARASASGRYSISLEHDWLGVGRAEIRIWLVHAVFQGDFRLIGCTVERVAAVD